MTILDRFSTGNLLFIFVPVAAVVLFGICLSSSNSACGFPAVADFLAAVFLAGLAVAALTAVSRRGLQESPVADSRDIEIFACCFLFVFFIATFFEIVFR